MFLERKHRHRLAGNGYGAGFVGVSILAMASVVIRTNDQPSLKMLQRARHYSLNFAAPIVFMVVPTAGARTITT